MTKETGFPAPPEAAAVFEHLTVAGGAGETALRRKTGDGRFVEYRTVNGEARGRDLGSRAADGSAVMSVLEESLASEFGGLSGKLLAETGAGSPDLDSIETALRDGVRGRRPGLQGRA